MSSPEVRAAVFAERRRQHLERALDRVRWEIWRAVGERLDREEAEARARLERPELLRELSKPLREQMRREVDRAVRRMRSRVEEEAEARLAREEKHRLSLPPSGGSILRAAGVPEEKIREWEEQGELARAWLEEVREEEGRDGREERRGAPKER